MNPKIVVIGSSNTDLVIQVPHFPKPGETILGDEFMMARGGKGANQAVAAARLGADVTFIARLGQDSFGEMALAACQAEQINTDFILFDAQKASGVALIMVDQHGENVIAVASGANAALSAADVRAAEPVIESCDCVLLQLETPLATVETAVHLANKYNVPVILNPAPARPLPVALLQAVDILTPNETEAVQLGVADSTQPGSLQEWRRQMGIKTIVLTLGSKGARIVNDDLHQDVSAYLIQAIDSTAAGDAFNGALAVALANGRTLPDAVSFANAAGALAVSKAGAQRSLPTLVDLHQFLSDLEKKSGD